jgi:hypothetical protein
MPTNRTEHLHSVSAATPGCMPTALQLSRCSPWLEVRHSCKHRLHALNDRLPLMPLRSSGPQCLQDNISIVAQQ